MQDKQDCKGDAGAIVKEDPLVARNIQKGVKTIPAASSGREYQVENKPGNERGDKRDQTKNIDQGIDGDLFHVKGNVIQFGVINRPKSTRQSIIWRHEIKAHTFARSRIKKSIVSR